MSVLSSLQLSYCRAKLFHVLMSLYHTTSDFISVLRACAPSRTRWRSTLHDSAACERDSVRRSHGLCGGASPSVSSIWFRNARLRVACSCDRALPVGHPYLLLLLFSLVVGCSKDVFKHARQQVDQRMHEHVILGLARRYACTHHAARVSTHRLFGPPNNHSRLYIDNFVIPVEEAFIPTQVGAEKYAEYCARVPRWLKLW